MREKKFRQPIYNIDGSFKEWFYWGLFIDNGEWVNIGCASRRYVINSKITDPLDSEQYTGLKDKNGKAIYEGCIVRCEYGLGKVIYHAGCFMVEWIDDKEADMEFLFSKNGRRQRKYGDVFEVIGNIHQNPELLK